MHQIISWGQSSCRIKSNTTISFYFWKLNTAQKRYTTTERKTELLSAIETCKEYKNILLVYHQPIIVFTDHKNNTLNGLKASDCVLLTCWLLLEEYGVTIEYLPGKKQKNVVADALSRLDIDSLKIQDNKEELLTLLSGSENNSISNIKWTIPMHTALIFKEQAKVKEQGLREMGLDQPHYSIQHIEGYDLLSYKEKIYIPQSLRQMSKSTVPVPWIFTSSGTRTEKTIRNTMTWPGLTQDVEHWLFMFHLSSMSNDKEGAYV
jgi:hypothetical protein